MTNLIYIHTLHIYYTYIIVVYIYIYIRKVGQFNRHPNDTPRARPWRRSSNPTWVRWGYFINRHSTIHWKRHVESTTCVCTMCLFDAFFQENMNVHHTTIYPHLYIYIIIHIYIVIYICVVLVYRESPRCSSCRDEAKWRKPRYWCPCNADGFSPGLDGWNAHGFVSSTHLFHGQTMVYRVPRHPSHDGSLYNWLWIPMSLCVD